MLHLCGDQTPDTFAQQLMYQHVDSSAHLTLSPMVHYCAGMAAASGAWTVHAGSSSLMQAEESEDTATQNTEAAHAHFGKAAAPDSPNLSNHAGKEEGEWLTKATNDEISSHLKMNSLSNSAVKADEGEIASEQVAGMPTTLGNAWQHARDDFADQAPTFDQLQLYRTFSNMLKSSGAEPEEHAHVICPLADRKEHGLVALLEEDQNSLPMVTQPAMTALPICKHPIPPASEHRQSIELAAAAPVLDAIQHAPPVVAKTDTLSLSAVEFCRAELPKGKSLNTPVEFSQSTPVRSSTLGEQTASHTHEAVGDSVRDWSPQDCTYLAVERSPAGPQNSCAQAGHVVEEVTAKNALDPKLKLHGQISSLANSIDTVELDTPTRSCDGPQLKSPETASKGVLRTEWQEVGILDSVTEPELPNAEGGCSTALSTYGDGIDHMEQDAIDDAHRDEKQQTLGSADVPHHDTNVELIAAELETIKIPADGIIVSSTPCQDPHQAEKSGMQLPQLCIDRPAIDDQELSIHSDSQRICTAAGADHLASCSPGTNDEIEDAASAATLLALESLPILDADPLNGVEDLSGADEAGMPSALFAYNKLLPQSDNFGAIVWLNEHYQLCVLQTLVSCVTT